MNAIDLVSIVAGVILAVVIVILGRRARPTEPDRSAMPGILGWAPLGLGLLTLALAFAVTAGVSFSAVIALGVATIIVAIAALRDHDRRWATWVGLVAGLVPTLFWGLFALGYGIIALTGCPDELRESAEDIAPPPGVEVRWEGTENESCRAEIPTDLSEEEVLTHYEGQFEADGWEPATSQNGPQWVAATQGDTVYEVGWVQPPGEQAAIMLLLSDRTSDE
ncbi:hypothetical protein GA707_07400 [Nostocoides sp. F2B08]|uniref:hypothetical protein n=1 Tax=Nostocoides sp. F2B08 TaxID=2653936 RepID=UPI0012638F17|nr:hypothetical protein [Tetrasphaera sp. F2B08]KAB7745718.1 hypothetical protein GA707_07400 [Tetrasphaera sp. F2B08]